MTAFGLCLGTGSVAREGDGAMRERELFEALRRGGDATRNEREIRARLPGTATEATLR